MPNPACIATWPFGQTSVRTALPLLQKGRPALECVIAGAQVIEDDATNHSVGYGGLPNSIGTVSLDACVMDGRTLDCGSVAGVENVRHVAALARRVMERSPHVMLVGEGARLFALQNGFELSCLNTPEGLQLWEKSRPRPRGQLRPAAIERDAGEAGKMPFLTEELLPFSHDTVAVL